MKSQEFRETYYGYLRYFLAKDKNTATSYDKYMALAYAVRSELTDNWIATQKRYTSKNVRRIYYLSMEYIFGKSLGQNITNLGIALPIRNAVEELGFSFEDILNQEDNFELGNRSKGRMSACSLDSMATLGIPSMAYGLRYDYAQFQQYIQNGQQSERPYDWLHRGHPWEIIRPEYSCEVNFEGTCRKLEDIKTHNTCVWENTEQVYAIPYDVPIPGYHNDVVNTLRLWSARASEEFLPDYLNHGDYIRACEEKSHLGQITKVLYPEEDIRRTTEMRMKQQYFFISATLQDIIRRYKVQNSDMMQFDKKVMIHLNGSRCALAIPELMRILIDVENVPWDEAWRITSNVFSYTSHAMSKDHMETWPVYKVTQIFPRHMQIIFDINQIYLENIRNTFSSDTEIIKELSLIEEGVVKRIRLANLAALGAVSVNGVSRQQTDIICKKLFPTHNRFFPDKFKNVTSGVAHRRWLLCANNALATLISDAIGTSWTTNSEELAQLEHLINDRGFLKQLIDIKKNTKQQLGTYIKSITGTTVDTLAMYDIQVGKIHPYKRQMLHLLYILHTYLTLKQGGTIKSSRVHIFSGKASPSDFLAKQIIHFGNFVAEIVNNDPDVRRYLTVAFIPNFGMTESEAIIPAADLSEQLSTPLLEASGTFNMKFMLNGALAISSLSGANIDLAEHIGDQSVFTFGKTADDLQTIGAYKPYELIESDLRLKAIFDFLQNFFHNHPHGNDVYPLLNSLHVNDRYFVLLDFNDYLRQQERVDTAYTDQLSWTQKCLQSIARSGKFTSDRSTMEYAQKIWKVPVQ